MRPLRHLTVAAITSITVLGTTVTAAHAQQDTITDKRADVVRYDGQDDTSGTVLDAEESLATGIDATSARVKHAKKNVSISMRFENLGDQRVFTYATVRVRGSKHNPDFWVYSNGSDDTVHVYNRTQTKLLCTGTLSRTNGESGQINIYFRRRCIGSPKEIKVHTGLVYIAGSKHDEEAPLFDESISSTKTRTTSSTSWLKAG